MAKRMKLESAVDTLVRSVEVQDLLNIPEAKKLYELDKEMKTILEDEKLENHDKVRKYERALAAYRNTQKRIIANGGLSMVNIGQRVDENTMGDESIADAQNVLKKLILQVIKEENDKMVNVQGPSTPAAPQQPVNVQMQPAAATNGPAPQPTLNVPMQPAPSSSSSVAAAATPAQVGTPSNIKRTSSNIPRSSAGDDASYATPSAPGSAATTPRGQVLRTLQQHGILAINGESVLAQVPATNTQYKRRSTGRSHELIFKTKTYQKALDHLLSGTKAKTPTQAKGLISIIYDGLRDKMPNFDSFINDYPNFKQYHETNGVPDLASLPWAMMK